MNAGRLMLPRFLSSISTNEETALKLITVWGSPFLRPAPARAPPHADFFASLFFAIIFAFSDFSSRGKPDRRARALRLAVKILA